MSAIKEIDDNGNLIKITLKTYSNTNFIFYYKSHPPQSAPRFNFSTGGTYRVDIKDIEDLIEGFLFLHDELEKEYKAHAWIKPNV